MTVVLVVVILIITIFIIAFPTRLIYSFPFDVTLFRINRI